MKKAYTWREITEMGFQVTEYDFPTEPGIVNATLVMKWWGNNNLICYFESEQGKKLKLCAWWSQYENRSYRPRDSDIDQLCDKAKHNHVERLQKGACTIKQGFVFNDLLTSIERVGDHCSNIALAMLELEADDFDTHAGQRRLMDDDPQAFQDAFNDYAARFSL